MPPTITTVRDDMNRANNSISLDGTGHSYSAAFGTSEMGIISNAAYSQATSYCASYRDAETYGPDIMVGVDVSALPGGDAFASARGSYVAADPGLSSWDGYQVLVYATRVALARIDNGSDTELINYTTVAPQANDVHIAERISGNWTLWRLRGGSWSSLGTVSDNTYSTSSGRIAVDMYDPSTAGRINALYGDTPASSDTPPVNTVAPVASPTPLTLGNEASCDEGTWDGSPAPTFAYQWWKGGVIFHPGFNEEIVGATSATYTPLTADFHYCVVTATNSEGSEEALSNEIDVQSSGDPPYNCYKKVGGVLVPIVARKKTPTGLFPPL